MSRILFYYIFFTNQNLNNSYKLTLVR